MLVEAAATEPIADESMRQTPQRRTEPASSWDRETRPAEAPLAPAQSAVEWSVGPACSFVDGQHASVYSVVCRICSVFAGRLGSSISTLPSQSSS